MQLIYFHGVKCVLMIAKETGCWVACTYKTKSRKETFRNASLGYT